MNPEQIAAFINSRLGDDDERLDASETAIIARKLEHVKARTYDVKYQTFKARRFIPVAPDADPAAETILYLQWDQFGMAKLISNYADDLPLVDVLAREFRTPVKSLGAAYQFSIMDLRRARMAGVSLDTMRASAARRSIESAIDNIAALGRPEVGLTGFCNHPNVPVYALTNGQWVSSNRTPTQMLADLHAFVDAVVAAGKDVFIPNTLLLPSRAFARIAQTFMSADNTVTVLSAFLTQNPYITDVDSWHRLDNVTEAVGNTRSICYFRDPEVLTLEIPQEFEQFPPQAKGLAFVIPVHARIGGTVIRYPVAVGYADDLV